MPQGKLSPRKSQLIPALFAAVTASQAVIGETLTGTLDDYTGPESQVLGGLMKPFEAGKVASDGQFVIPLDGSFRTALRQSVAAGNEENDGWKMQFNKIEDAFSCAGGEVAVSGGDQPVISLFGVGWLMVADLEKQIMHGRFAAASSKEFAKAHNSFGQVDLIPGWSVDWYYLDEPATVSGSCSMTMYAANQSDSFSITTDYDLELNAGWNMVRYEVHSIYEDPDGPDRQTHESFRTIEEQPDGLVFPFFPETRPEG